MRAPCLLLSVLFSCAIQGQITQGTDGAPVISARVFAPSQTPEAPNADDALRAVTTALPERTLRAVAMEGPYDDLEDYCEWLFRTSARFNPVSDENSCSYSSRKAGQGAVQGAQLIYASFGSGASVMGEYHIAMQTSAGWFVSEEQYLDDISDGGAGSFYQARLSQKRLTVESLIPGGEAEVVLRATKKVSRYCTVCDSAAERNTARPWSNQEQLIVCSVEGAQPGCVALSSTRDAEGAATKLSLSFGADEVMLSREATAFSVSKEVTVSGQYRLVFP